MNEKLSIRDAMKIADASAARAHNLTAGIMPAQRKERNNEKNII